MVDKSILTGGLQYIPAIAISQIIYLDFDGEVTSYNGEILSLDSVEVQDALLTAERINNIVTQLNGKYASKGIRFVTQRPEHEDYSTIFVGKTNAFDQFGTFAGLAETLDEGNLNKSDKAFVNLDSSSSDAEIIDIVSHETDHLTGRLKHGGEGLNAYAVRYNVSAGISSTGVTLWPNDSMFVENGGIASFTAVNEGWLYVSNGGAVSATSVNTSGYLNVGNGGTANETVLNDLGELYVHDGGTVNETTVNSYGYLDVGRGGTAVSTTVNSGGYLDVESSGAAISATVNSGGILCLLSGAEVTALNLKAGGQLGGFSFAEDRYWEHIVDGSVTVSENVYIIDSRMHVLLGGTAVSATVNGGHYYKNLSGFLYVSSGGTATAATVNSDGYLYVYDGGTANKTTVNSRGNLYVSSGGTATAAAVNTGGKLHITNGGTATAATVNSRGNLYVSNGGIAENTTVNSRGNLYVSNGGIAGNTMVNAGGNLFVSNGGIAENTMVNAGGNLFVSNDGTAENTTVNSAGCLEVSRYGTAASTTVNEGGQFYINSGGTATAVKENGGYVDVTIGANVIFVQNTISGLVLHTLASLHTVTSAISTTVNFGGSLIVSGGTAISTTVNSDGSLYVHNGGTAASTTVNQSGYFSVSDGEVFDTQVNSGGTLVIECGGYGENITVCSGGTVEVYGEVRNLTVERGSMLGYSVGATVFQGYLDCWLTQESINTLREILPTSSGLEALYLRVDDTTLREGVHMLADDIGYSFSPTVTIGSEKVLSVNGDSQTVGDRCYSLELTDGDLYISIEKHVAAPPQGSVNGVYWADAQGAETYVEYSLNNFDNALKVQMPTGVLDTFGLPAGEWQWRVSNDNGVSWQNGSNIYSQNQPGTSQEFSSVANGNNDLFFAAADGIWHANYAAQHLGDGIWNGTQEQIFLKGKNKITDIFAGSLDANVLVLTDDANGDALFVDDIYSAFGSQARFSLIDEIRAGSGDDIVDMTSVRYAYAGSEIRIRGGAGNDTIWGGAETNVLFGDAGNDRLVGASKNDVLAGGSGNDSMHGGGGDDIFTFRGAFGNDTVEQLTSGSVTLWFETGNESNWDSETLTYADGVNSVTVTGCTSVMLRFGADSTLPAVVFETETSEKVFEDKGMLA